MLCEGKESATLLIGIRPGAGARVGTNQLALVAALPNDGGGAYNVHPLRAALLLAVSAAIPNITFVLLHRAPLCMAALQEIAWPSNVKHGCTAKDGLAQ